MLFHLTRHFLFLRNFWTVEAPRLTRLHVFCGRSCGIEMQQIVDFGLIKKCRTWSNVLFSSEMLVNVADLWGSQMLALWRRRSATWLMKKASTLPVRRPVYHFQDKMNDLPRSERFSWPRSLEHRQDLCKISIWTLWKLESPFFSFPVGLPNQPGYHGHWSSEVAAALSAYRVVRKTLLSLLIIASPTRFLNISGNFLNWLVRYRDQPLREVPTWKDHEKSTSCRESHNLTIFCNFLQSLAPMYTVYFMNVELSGSQLGSSWSLSCCRAENCSARCRWGPMVAKPWHPSIHALTVCSLARSGTSRLDRFGFRFCSSLGLLYETTNNYISIHADSQTGFEHIWTFLLSLG